MHEIIHCNSIILSWWGANILVKSTTKGQQQTTSSKYEKKFVDTEIIHTNTFGQWIDYSKILFVFCYFAELFERYVFSEIFFIWERKGFCVFFLNFGGEPKTFFTRENLFSFGKFTGRIFRLGKSLVFFFVDWWKRLECWRQIFLHVNLSLN